MSKKYVLILEITKNKNIHYCNTQQNITLKERVLGII